jgi:hypothetical protein
MKSRLRLSCAWLARARKLHLALIELHPSQPKTGHHPSRPIRESESDLSSVLVVRGTDTLAWKVGKCSHGMSMITWPGAAEEKETWIPMVLHSSYVTLDSVLCFRVYEDACFLLQPCRDAKT